MGYQYADHNSASADRASGVARSAAATTLLHRVEGNADRSPCERGFDTEELRNEAKPIPLKVIVESK